MGTGIDQEEFDDSDYPRFTGRLEECLSTLGQLLQRPGFGVGPATVGAELELFLVDAAARPLPHNQAVRAAVADPRITVELDRFDLELNASPVPLAGRPFAVLGSELSVLLDHVAHAARDHAGRLALISILPTLTQADLGPGVMTDVPRYRALDRGLRRLRQDPYRIRIAGEDPLGLAREDVALEGANSPVVAGADAVLHGLDPALGIATALHRQRPAMPVVVEQHRRADGSLPPVPEGCILLAFPSSVKGQIDALWRALANRPETGPLPRATQAASALGG
jgi:hypothetical protein